jgi:hypothetical protein
MIGDAVAIVGGEERRFPPLTVRQVCTLQSVMAERMAAETAADCRALGLDTDETLRRTRTAREDARLSTTLVRSCFTFDGACRILTESVGADRAESMLEGIAPDDLTELALQTVGFEWSADVGKWVRRSRVNPDANGPAIG